MRTADVDASHYTTITRNDTTADVDAWICRWCILVPRKLIHIDQDSRLQNPGICES